ncbi:MAG: LuxR family maltose regulon positive regulatory protein [Oleiphilaceae bacterium]|jgi:LuxR family maltose regulon positive regulatory protein
MATSFNPDTSPPSFKKHLIRLPLLRQIESQSKKLTLIQAPPGYGKTSFLKQVYDHLKLPHLWMNFRQSDNDPINLLHKWNTALIQLESAEQESSDFSHTSGFTSPSIELWTRSIIDHMNKHPRLAIFLNDADFIHSHEAIEVINLLLQMSHAGIRIFMTASSNLYFSYSHLLIENQLASINQEALRFSKEDIQAIFKLHKKTIPEDALSKQLADVSEGWPAAAFYMASALESEAKLKLFIEDANLKQQAFDRYFIERVFEQQAPETQQFLLKLSLLDRFNLGICQSLSDTPEQWQAFWPYVEQHTFITPIEASGKWYRFHQLFGLFLKHRCQIEFSEIQRNQWQLSAAKCFHNEKAIDDAIPLAIQSKNFDQAAQWMETAFTTVVVRMGKHITYHSWYDSLPEDIIKNYPRLRIGSIWARLANRHFLSVAEQLQWLIQNKALYSEKTQQEIIRTAALIHCCMEGLKDDATKASPLIESWLNQWQDPAFYSQADDHHYEMGLALLIKGYCAKCLSDFKSSREALHQSMQHLEAFGSFYGITLAKSLLAVTYAKQGFHHEALREALEGYQIAKQKLGEKSHNGFGLAALLAAIHYEHDEIAAVRPYLKDTLPYLKEQSPSDLLIAAFETQARLLVHDKAIEETVGFLKDGIKWSETQNLPRLNYKLIDDLIVLLIRQKRHAEAERYASEYNLILRSADDFNIESPQHNIASRSIIYCLWQRKAFHDAECIIKKLLKRTEDKGQLRRKAEWLKLSALNLDFLGKKELVNNELSELLAFAQTQNYFRMLVDEPGLHKLLVAFKSDVNFSKLNTEVQRFYHKLMNKIQPKGSADNAVFIEALTAKEIAIMSLLSEGLPNKIIAEKLLVSLGTLKWHLHNIYSKLQVKNRTQALLETKRLGYI